MRLFQFIVIVILSTSGCSIYKAHLTEKLLIESIAYKKNGDYENQLKVLEKSAKIIESDSTSDSSGKVYDYFGTGMFLFYLKMGHLYSRFHSYDKALEAYRKSQNTLGDFKHDNDLKNTINIYIADIYYKLGRNKEAIRLLEKSLARSNLGMIDELRIYTSLNSLYIQEKNYKYILEYAKKALVTAKTASSENGSTVCEAHNLIGDAYKYLEEYDKAQEEYEYCLNISKKRDNKDLNMNYEEYVFHKLIGGVYLDLFVSNFKLGELFFQKRDYERAKKYFSDAKDALVVQNFTDKVFKADIVYYEGLIELYQHNYKQAIKLFNERLMIKKQHFGINSLEEHYQDLAYIYFNIKDLKSAYIHMKKAYDIFIDNRNNHFLVLNNLGKYEYLNSKGRGISNLLDIAYEYKINGSQQTNIQKKQLSQTTFNDWLNNKGAVLDSENMMTTFQNNTSNKQLKEEIDTLRQKQRFLAVLKQQYPDNNIALWKQKIQSLENEIDNFIYNISKNVKAFSEEQELQLVSYDEIVSNLKEDEFYIDYAKSEEYYYIFTVDKAKNVSFIQINESETKKIDSLIKAFREEIVEFKNLNKYQKLTQKELQSFQNSSQRILSELYRLLIEKPLGNKLKNKKSLVVSTDGILRLLPFEALYNSTTQKYLVEAFDIKYIPSGKEFIRLHRYTKNERSYSNEVIVFANPDFEDKSTDRGDVINFTTSRTWKALIGTKAEAEFIQKTFDDVKVYEQQKANEVELLNIKQPKILHIATHGFFINDNDIENPMLKSGLVLSGANVSAEKGRDYGFVTALKLSGLNLRGTDLVVLSACETGVVDVNDTDSISGLGKAFIQAGAKDVVMSLWSVDDNATKELMIDFYRGINEHSNYARALREAKLKMIDEGRHPFYWGGFVLNGL